MDYFLNDTNCSTRLYDEWQKYKSLIIAYDFDNTVFDYYQKGHTFKKVISLLRECKKLGYHLSVFTSCNDDRIPDLEKYLKQNNIPYDGINETPDFFPFQGRNIYYNILLYDRAGLSAAYKILDDAIRMIRSKIYSERCS